MSNITRYKYPRTLHLPWSLGATSDDKKLKDTTNFDGKLVVVTEKMDGENTTMHREGIYARSVDSGGHPSRNWVTNLWANLIAYRIDPQIRICGENLYAKHSIAYNNLESYFLAFNVWDGTACWRFDKTKEFVEQLGISLVPVLGICEFSKDVVHGLWEKTCNKDTSEGYVVRLYGSFYLNEFQSSVAKYVRQNHVTTDSHWMHKTVITNKLI